MKHGFIKLTNCLRDRFLDMDLQEIIVNTEHIFALEKRKDTNNEVVSYRIKTVRYNYEITKEAYESLEAQLTSTFTNIDGKSV